MPDGTALAHGLATRSKVISNTFLTALAVIAVIGIVIVAIAEMHDDRAHRVRRKAERDWHRNKEREHLNRMERDWFADPEHEDPDDLIRLENEK